VGRFIKAVLIRKGKTQRGKRKMTDNNPIGCGTIIAGTIAAGLALSQAGAFGAGYATRSCTAENAQVCYEKTAPLRSQFKEHCEGRLFDEVNNEALEEIISKRNKIQKEFGCEKEKWICRPVDQYRVQESPTEAVFKLE